MIVNQGDFCWHNIVKMLLENEAIFSTIFKLTIVWN